VDSDDLHDAAAHISNADPVHALASLLKHVVVLTAEVAKLKARHSPCIHQSEPEHDTG
jgi:hypothetical protein